MPALPVLGHRANSLGLVQSGRSDRRLEAHRSSRVWEGTSVLLDQSACEFQHDLHPVVMLQPEPLDEDLLYFITLGLP